MKKLLLLLVLLIVLKVNAQSIKKTEKVTDHSIHVVGDRFEGIIFQDNYFQDSKDTIEMKVKRYNPSSQDIILVESILIANKGHTQKDTDIDYIFNHLTDYHRQYIGYFNEKGEKIMYVNCFPTDEDWANEKIKTGQNKGTPKWYDKLFKVFDGGKSFWQTSINLSTKKIVALSVNGVG